MRQLIGWIVIFLFVVCPSGHRLTAGLRTAADVGAGLRASPEAGLRASPLTIQWREGAPLPRPKGGAATGWAEGRLILAGGTWWEGVPDENTPPAGESKEEVKHWIPTVHTYDPQTDTWGTLPDLPHPVGYGVGVVVEGTFYVLGGAEGDQGFTDCFRLARKGDKPTAVEQLEQQEAQTEGMEGDGKGGKEREGEEKGNQETGKLGNWGAKHGKLGNWGAKHGELGNWGTGKLGNWETETNFLISQFPNFLISQFPSGTLGTSPGIRYLWQTIPPLPEPRVYAGAGVMGDTIYLFGGSRDPHDLSTVSNALWSLQPALPHTGWQTLPPLPGPPRAGMATAVCANRLFVFGGFHLDGQGQVENLADAYLYTPALRKWQRLADTPLPVEGWMAEVIQNRFILLCGGYATVAFSTDGPVKGFVPDVLVYDVRTNKYTYATPMPHALMDAQPVRVGETLYLAGGEDRPKHRAPWTMIGTVQVR